MPNPQNSPMKCFFSLVTRVMLNNFGTQAMSVDVGINFGSAYIFVPKHTLYDAKVGATFEQVGGEGVAEGMWADGFLEPRLLSQFLDDMEHRDA